MADTHAVVIGAGIAGLCSARALAGFYDRVTVLDRDALPDRTTPRSGAPQGNHAHAVLVRGVMAVRDLFPGLVEELAAEGRPSGDVLAGARVYLGPHRLTPVRSDLEGLCVARPVLEHRMRRHLAALPPVTFAPETTVAGLVTEAGRVTAVRLKDRTLPADLVVDASGRGSRMPRWLDELGYGETPEERVDIDMAYSSCVFDVPPGTVDARLGVLMAPGADNPRGGSAVDLGGGHWLISLFGYRGYHPPVTPDGFVDFTARLAGPDLHRAASAGTPVGRPIRFRTPAAVRRHYERLPRFPENLVVLGDAVSSFNPVYGQGMTIAASEAVALRDHLRTRGTRDFGLLRRVNAEAGAVAWMMSNTNDLAIATIPGHRSRMVRLNNAYLARLRRVAAYDGKVARAFMRAANLVDPPLALVRPSIAYRVLTKGRSRTPEEVLARVDA